MSVDSMTLDQFDFSGAPAPDSPEEEKRIWAIEVIQSCSNPHGIAPGHVSMHLVTHASMLLDFIEGKIDRLGRPVPVDQWPVPVSAIAH